MTTRIHGRGECTLRRPPCRGYRACRARRVWEVAGRSARKVVGSKKAAAARRRQELPSLRPEHKTVMRMDPVQALAMNSRLDVNEVEDLVLAKSLLEQPGLAVRLGNLIGTPLQQGFKMMPPSWAAVVHRSVRLALWGALDVAVTTLDRRRFNWARKISYKVLVGTTGGLGGAFGLAALPVELPVSTILMLRGVAEIARGEGFELDSWDTRVACLEVFAFGGPAPKNAPAESGYWLVRSAMATAVKDATTYLARRAMVEGGVPVLARLVEAIASRFGAVVSQQLAAKAVPLLGGVTGSAINVLFMDHFQKIALGHFIVKRLEQKYSRAEIREVYEGLELPRHFSVKV